MWLLNPPSVLLPYAKATPFIIFSDPLLGVDMSGRSREDPLDKQLRSLRRGDHTLEKTRLGNWCPRKQCGAIQRTVLRRYISENSLLPLSAPLRSRSPSHSVCMHEGTKSGKHRQGLQTFVVVNQVAPCAEPAKPLQTAPTSASVCSAS